MPPPPARVLPILVLSQFFCTSLWFAGNAVAGQMLSAKSLETSLLGPLTSAVQAGFIGGTLLFAFLSIADRFPPSRVFFLAALAGAAANLGSIWAADALTLLLSRALTGVALAGIYPVGMKIAADYHDRGLGHALGYLVGALVLGTAFPHLLNSLSAGMPYDYVFYGTSALALLGGGAIGLFVPGGPHRVPSQGFDPQLIPRVFRDAEFRRAAFGYFGHMWELYAFWAFVPVLLHAFNQHSSGPGLAVAPWSFAIIAAGAISCVWGGYWSRKAGSAQPAAVFLALSGAACLFTPLLVQAPAGVFLAGLLLWGLSVIPDSPQLSSLVAAAAPPHAKGTALTVVNAIGFAVTIPAIELLNTLTHRVDSPLVYWVLFVGPAVGLAAMGRGAFRRQVD